MFQSSASHRSKRTGSEITRSSHSSNSSAKKQEAAAELAATEATLKVMQEMEREQRELENLEAENRKRLAQQEAENNEKQKALEEKRRQIERLETVKKMKAAKARLKVYEQESTSDEEISDLLHRKSRPEEAAPYLVSLPEFHPQQRTVPQEATSKQCATNATQEDSTTALARALAESVNISRLPVPEPSVFIGDPLKYKDWKMSFETLIDRKNIPVNEKLYYLRKYVGGPARKAIESYFLLGTDTAYLAAWNILEERYGSSFVIAKAFRDKLTSWPRIGPKDSAELQEFSDFLRGCEAAMFQIRNLEVLNDCSENQKMLSKLPDWLTASWNRKVIDIQEQSGSFPTFSNFVDFVTREAKIACNPITSLHALKASDFDKTKTSKIRSVGAKVLASSSEEKSDTKMCIFCERPNHSWTSQLLIESSLYKQRACALDVSTLVTIQKNVKGEVFVIHAKGNTQHAYIRNVTGKSKGQRMLTRNKRTQGKPNNQVQKHQTRQYPTVSSKTLTVISHPQLFQFGCPQQAIQNTRFLSMPFWTVRATPLSFFKKRQTL